jgi:hypothetical protein
MNCQILLPHAKTATWGNQQELLNRFRSETDLQWNCSRTWSSSLPEPWLMTPMGSLLDSGIWTLDEIPWIRAYQSIAVTHRHHCRRSVSGVLGVTPLIKIEQTGRLSKPNMKLAPMPVSHLTDK